MDIEIKNIVADFFEQLIPYLDWSADSTREDLRDRLVEIARICNEFSKKIPKGQ